MKWEALSIPGLMLATPRIHGDERGLLFESFNESEFCNATGVNPQFVQENHSRSACGVLRGIHLQAFPRAQGKLVRVVRGAIFDVAVDARRHSPTFGKWCGVELSETNPQALWVPAGFGHGFLSCTTSHCARGAKKKCGDMAVDNILHNAFACISLTPCPKII